MHPGDSLPENEKTAFARERERLHQQMLSAVSHDLKTPLAAIIGSLEIHTRFKETLKEDKKEVLLTTALQEAYRLDSFITNILDMSKLDNGFVNFKKQPIDIKNLLEDCRAKVSHLLNDANFTIETKEESGKIILDTDSGLLVRAISCLIDNAVKHGGGVPTIKALFGHRGKGIFISIIDNGPGIRPEDREVIFNKYTRLTKQDHQNAGTGLGLAICRSITTLLGGTIVAEDIAKGACFTLYFEN